MVEFLLVSLTFRRCRICTCRIIPWLVPFHRLLVVASLLKPYGWMVTNWMERFLECLLRLAGRKSVSIRRYRLYPNLKSHFVQITFSVPCTHFIEELSNNTISATTPLSTGDTVIVKAINGDDISGTVVPPDGWPHMSEYICCFVLHLWCNTILVIWFHPCYCPNLVAEELLLNHNLLTGNMPSSICTLRLLKPSEFRALHADCSPRTGIYGQAQINCENGCCTSCFIGELV